MTLLDATCVLPVVNYDTSDDDVAAKKLQIQHLHIHYSFKMATHDYCPQSSNSYLICHFFYFYGINWLVEVQYDVYNI